jgi:uncharacterized protein YpmB
MWKKWILFISVLIVILSSLVLFWMNQLVEAHSGELVKAGQKALNETVMQSIERGYIYTGGPTEYVFYGKDAAARPVWVFVNRDTGQLYAELESNGYSQNKIEQIAKQPPLSMIQVLHAIPGMIDPHVTTEFSKRTTNKLVWELYGTDAKGHQMYAYFDFYTGKLLWSYSLHS